MNETKDECLEINFAEFAWKLTLRIACLSAIVAVGIFRSKEGRVNMKVIEEFSHELKFQRWYYYQSIDLWFGYPELLVDTHEKTRFICLSFGLFDDDIVQVFKMRNWLCSQRNGFVKKIIRISFKSQIWSVCSVNDTIRSQKTSQDGFTVSNQGFWH